MGSLAYAGDLVQLMRVNASGGKKGDVLLFETSGGVQYQITILSDDHDGARNVIDIPGVIEYCAMNGDVTIDVRPENKKGRAP